METYRLKSTLVENSKEYVIQTANDTSGSIRSAIYVNGEITDSHSVPHPAEVSAEEVLSLVQVTHEEQKEEIETLLDAYKKVLTVGNPDKAFHLGTAFLYRRLYPEARELFRSVVDLAPSHHQAWNYLGTTHLLNGETQQAIQCGQKAVQLRPNFADYHNSLGEACLAARDFATAIKEFERAIKINLYYGDAYFNMGLSYIHEALSYDRGTVPVDIPAKAISCFEKATLIHPDYDQKLLAEARSTLGGGDFQRSLPLFLKVRQIKKESKRREFAAFHMRFLAHSEWASEEAILRRIQYLQGEIKKNPTYVDLHADLARGRLELARLSWEKGMEHYRRALSMNPSLTQLNDLLARLDPEFERINEIVDSASSKS